MHRDRASPAGPTVVSAGCAGPAGWGGLALLAIACGPGDGSSGTVVRDSAGIEIVESASPAWSDERAWRVPDTPSVAIGSETDPAAQFGYIRGVTRLGDGRIVVADGATDQLRYFSASGAHIRTVGRHGRGPAEFDFIEWIGRLPGDSLLAYDANNGRLSLFDPAGELVGAVRVPEAPWRSPRPHALMAGGTILGRSGVGAGTNPPLGSTRFTTLWMRIGRDLTVVDTLGTSPGGEGYLVVCGPDGGGICNYQPFFARTGSATAWRDRLFVGDGERYEITVLDTAGRTIRSIRHTAPPRRATTEGLAAQREERLGAIADPVRRQAAERVYAQIPVPEVMPAYTRLVADTEGNLWAEDYRVTAADPALWTVFDSAGRMLGSVRLPSSFRVIEIHADAMVGVARDSLDTEQVRAYGIVKPRR